ncbi:serine/threonine-protein kinase Chk2-like isoform X2 [Homarus americanus]|uniref:Serine/threonine-protein kinase Chk2-like n=1 Tax=Homarus americanus TaxID=6706 RepID=A0A8J5MW03_HOMAM|nr:serine/threonine-protein kinase Chk2-like isoform X2 [Homarus americanus]KAG7165109.1 serine/threonine-protein kinase Chk2-like [Homarus americanus]
MDNIINSQASTQGLRETQEVLSQNAFDVTDAEIIWGRLFSVRENISVCNLINNCYTFGRGDADFRFSKDHFGNSFLPAISKIHFKVTRESKPNSEVVVILEDLSCNGTFVNKQQVGRGNKIVLQNNDEIALAHANKKIFVFHDCVQNDAQDYPEQLTQMYTITRTLGEGNFGEVKLAYKQGTLERCAVKILKKRGSQLLLNNIKQINNEIELLQSVDHPCIIRLQDVIETPEKMYIIMELAEGGELFDRLAANGRLPEATVKFYFFQLALAVQYLHMKSITHRDIKPENILLATDEEYTRVKLTDFGLSKLAVDASQMTTFCGTPTYIAPELLQFEGLSYNKKVDLWSLGVVLFVSLSGYPPFYGEEDAKLRFKIKNAVYNFQPKLWTEISDEAKDLITKLLVSEPSRRLNIDQTLSHPWLQDELMKKKALDLIHQDQSLPTNKRRLEESEADELELSDAKTPRIQKGIGIN